MRLQADMDMERAINNREEAIARQAIKWKYTTIRSQAEDHPTDLLLNLVMEELTSQEVFRQIIEQLQFRGTLSQRRGHILNPHIKCQDNHNNLRHTQQDPNRNTVLIEELPKCTPQIMRTEIAFFQNQLKILKLKKSRLYWKNDGKKVKNDVFLDLKFAIYFSYVH